MLAKLVVFVAIVFGLAVKLGYVPDVLTGLSSNHDHSPLYVALLLHRFISYATL